MIVLLAQPVKEAVQNALDRVFYRDRYDYRRALVAFARDLNADLDVNLVPLQVHVLGKSVPFMLEVLFGAVLFAASLGPARPF